MIKLEAVANPLKYDNIKCALTEVGIKRMKIFEVIGVRNQNGHIQLDYSKEYSFDFIPIIKFEIITDEEHSGNVISAILKSAGTAQISIEKKMIPIINSEIKTHIDNFLESAAKYSKN